MTYETEQATRAEEMAGEDTAFARRRQGELMAQPAAGGS
jgi:hypothetical protein